MNPRGAVERPRFSLVPAVYNVARYLDEFFTSIEAQDFDLSRVEIIAVDDGSTDNSLEVLEKWQRKYPDLISVVTKANGGPASARNHGLEKVRGEWVAFPDPDDVLDKNFLKAVDRFLRQNTSTVMVATRRMVFSDLTKEESRHVLDAHFVPGSDRLRNLDYDTGHFHGHAASTFFDVDLLRQQNLTMDERISPTFEDGHFCIAYLLRAAEPIVGFVSSAEYNYRKRGDGTSELDRSWANPGRFINVLQYGMLDLLRDGAQRRGGRPPNWVQGMVLYELSWYFRQNERNASAENAGHGDVVERFHELLAEICSLLTETGVRTYGATRFAAIWRDVLLHGYDSAPWHTPFGIVNKADRDQYLVRVTYRYVGELPEETFLVYGKPTRPKHEKIRDIALFDHIVLHERIVWLPFGTLRVLLDGEDLDLRFSEPELPRHRLLAFHIEKALVPTSEAARSVVGAPLTRAERVVQWLSTQSIVRYYFRDAWVLIDRVFNSDDSAEHLFAYLRASRRSVNAWFVIERGTPDYERLRKRYGHRVLAHGSLRWTLAMLTAQHLISSHIDEVIVKPRSILRFGKPKWRTTFLQHGVMKDDLSLWLNPKGIDVFVTSTRAEYQSVVADHTTYRYTTREVALTGLPRFDRILAAGRKFPPDKRDLILIAPTWRDWLSAPAPGEITGRRVVDARRFQASQFAQNWTEFINDDSLRELAERSGLKVALLLHPNFEGYAQLQTAPHVEVLSFTGQNIQDQFARARVLITDYSSMFFNAAYIDRPVVYFQFDRERVLTGSHTGRKGYFDYEQQGFGPVTLTARAAVDATAEAVDHGPDPQRVYLDRISEAFPKRDGRCCERAADAILRSTGASAPKYRPLARRLASRGRRELRRARKRVKAARTAA